METNNTRLHENWRLLKAIAGAALIVGTLDIMAAAVQTLINGRDPMQMLKFIASGIFGTSAFTGGPAYAIYGLFFHYCIAAIWTTLFFLIYPKLPVLSRHKVLTGIGYALLVNIAMSRIVLPLSNAPVLPFTIKSAIISTFILIIAVGLPLSFMAGKFYDSPR